MPTKLDTFQRTPPDLAVETHVDRLTKAQGDGEARVAFTLALKRLAMAQRRALKPGPGTHDTASGSGAREEAEDGAVAGASSPGKDASR